MAEGIKGVVVMAVATPAKVVELSGEAEEVAAAPEVVDLEEVATVPGFVPLTPPLRNQPPQLRGVPRGK